MIGFPFPFCTGCSSRCSSLAQSGRDGPGPGSSHGALVAGDFWKRRESDRLKGVFLDSANLRPVDRLNRLGNLAPAAIRRRLAGRNSSV